MAVVNKQELPLSRRLLFSRDYVQKKYRSRRGNRKGCPYNEHLLLVVKQDKAWGG